MKKVLDNTTLAAEQNAEASAKFDDRQAEIPAGSLLRISFELRLPVAATKNQISEWLPYAVLESGGCSLSNPLMHCGPNDFANSFKWEDTGLLGQREEYNHSTDAGGAHYYNVRYLRTRRGG